MIHITRCPYRVSLLGGGSDLDWFVKEFDYGLCLGFAINKFTHIAVKPKSTPSLGILNYSSRELYESLDLIAHPIIRSVFTKFNFNTPVELTSFGSDVNGGGLGGSSSFTNALIASVLKLQNIDISRNEVAAYSSQIEIEILKKPIGNQDQYFTALGGLNFLKFTPYGGVQSIYDFNKEQTNSFCKYLNSLVLVNTNINRVADKVLRKIKVSKKETANQILEIRESAECFLNHLEKNNLISFELLESLINKSWDKKRSLPGVLNPKLLEIELFLKNKGVHMIKLLGAGGGGSFICRPKQHKDSFISEINKNGFKCSSIALDNDGLKSIEF